jgi:predicted urease superfamily metal-dependent hydrolase
MGRPEAAIIWEDVFSMKTEEMAKGHLQQLQSLQKKYGMKMPSVANHLEERFVKPLSVNHMLACIRSACEDAESGRRESPAFETLLESVEEYLKTTSGSGIDVPAWLRTLEEELNRIHESGEVSLPDAEPQLNLPIPALSLKELRQQLKQWKQPLSERKGKA